jgi:hypothetical protein
MKLQHIYFISFIFYANEDDSNKFLINTHIKHLYA